MAISSDTLVLTTKDWIKAGDLLPDDYVYGLDGLPLKILSTQNYTPTKMYSILLDDGLEILADRHQALPLEDEKYRINLCEFLSNKRSGKLVRNTKRRQQLRVKTVEQLLELEDKFSIPVTQPITFRHQDLPVHPYIAGLWFGFMNRKNTMWLNQEQYKHLEKVFRANRFKLTKLRTISFKKHYEVMPNIGVSFLTDNRFPVIPTTIPKEYLFASPEQRIEFLRGFFICRRNCYDKKKKRYKFTSGDKKFLKLIRFLAEGLGMKTYIQVQSIKGETFVSLFIRTDISLHPDHEPELRSAGYKRRYITDIEEVDPQPCTHIKAERPFIIGTEGFIAIC